MTRYEVKLDCMHVAYFPDIQPLDKEILYCIRCDGYRVVVEGGFRKYVPRNQSAWARCRDCKWHSNWSAPQETNYYKLYAETHAERHYHTVDFYDPISGQFEGSYGVQVRVTVP